MLTITAARALIGETITGPVAVRVDAGRVISVEPGLAAGADVRLPTGLLSPGLVDVQLNGAFGVDMVAAEPEQWSAVSEKLLATGVTAYQPTFITAPVDQLSAALSRAARARDTLAGAPVARVLGAHVEGPFISPERPGMHDRSLMVDPTSERLDVLLAHHERERILTTLTLAPERPHAIEAVRRLAASGVVVSVGHSDAVAAEVLAAVDAGATMVTHVFNAQRGLGHREPGVAGTALADPRLTVGLIADLKHVAAPICAVVMRAAAGRVALVTDAMAAAGMPPGRYVLGGIEVLLDDENLPRLANGTIGGSALTLDRAVRNIVGLGFDQASTLLAATRVPADLLRRPDLGRIAPGALADLVWFDDALRPGRVWLGGTEVELARPVIDAG